MYVINQHPYFKSPNPTGAALAAFQAAAGPANTQHINESLFSNTGHLRPYDGGILKWFNSRRKKTVAYFKNIFFAKYFPQNRTTVERIQVRLGWRLLATQGTLY